MEERLQAETVKGYLFELVGYSENPTFNDYLDDTYGPLEIEGSIFLPSKVLYQFEPETYRLALQDYQQQLVDALIDRVTNLFPSPVATSFYRFERGFENNLQRLHFLRDTWEALINFMHALVLAEVRVKNLNLADTGLTTRQFVSDRLAQRLQTIAKVLEKASSSGVHLESSEIVTRTVLEEMQELNRTRNGFSHSVALSEQQAREVIYSSYDRVLSVLAGLSALEDVRTYSYVSTEEDHSRIRCDSFVGHSSSRTIDTISLDEVDIDTRLLSLEQGRPFAVFRGQALDLSPFWVCVLDETGHFVRMATFRRMIRDEAGTMTLEFEVIGEGSVIRHPEVTYKGELDRLADIASR